MTAFTDQTIAYQYTVAEEFDGTTAAENPTLGNDEDQFYVASQARAGLFPVNEPSQTERSTSRGNRWLTWLELKLDAPAPSGAAIEIVDNTSVEGEVTVLKVIRDLTGESLAYIDTGVMVPQGAVLRVSGTGGGVFRFHVTFIEPQNIALLASLILAAQGSSGGGDSTGGLIFSEEVRDEAGSYPMTVGVIERFDAANLSDDEMIFVLPADPEKDQETGIKDVGDSFTAVQLIGNGNLVETLSDAPAAAQSSAIARQSLILKFDGEGRWFFT